ncbi:PDZ domain-containing protein [Rubripirellula reticaptiva]|uniref:PDZ domain-containing protein n=1 Tax=Rubripirellula reticaptiva TaxID=2528013 RepID=UPI0011B42E7C|nr:PDZ domain-containing protein [Rubripirellula reticaptiva]
MDQFGVRDPQLRADARTPEIPALRNISSDPKSIVYDWLGGKIRNIEGAEYSVWSISPEIGGVMVLFTPGYREFGAAGLRNGDLINTCNNQMVKSVDDLARIINEAPADQSLSLQFRREGSRGNKVGFAERPPVPELP